MSNFTIEIDCETETETGVAGGVDAFATITRPDGDSVLAEITVIYEDHSGSWAPFGDAPDMWICNPSALTDTEIVALSRAVRCHDFELS